MSLLRHSRKGATKVLARRGTPPRIPFKIRAVSPWQVETHGCTRVFEDTLLIFSTLCLSFFFPSNYTRLHPLPLNARPADVHRGQPCFGVSAMNWASAGRGCVSPTTQKKVWIFGSPINSSVFFLHHQGQKEGSRNATTAASAQHNAWAVHMQIIRMKTRCRGGMRQAA